jgi:hypothetical protein
MKRQQMKNDKKPSKPKLTIMPCCLNVARPKTNANLSPSHRMLILVFVARHIPIIYSHHMSRIRP